MSRNQNWNFQVIMTKTTPDSQFMSPNGLNTIIFNLSNVTTLKQETHLFIYDHAISRSSHHNSLNLPTLLDVLKLKKIATKSISDGYDMKECGLCALKVKWRNERVDCTSGTKVFWNISYWCRTFFRCNSIQNFSRCVNLVQSVKFKV